MKTKEERKLLVRKIYRSTVTDFPYVFDVWELKSLFYVIVYGTARYSVVRCKTELEAVLELKQLIEKASEDYGTLMSAKKLEKVGLLNEKNPIWKFIKKTKGSRFSMPWPWSQA